jgi:hypothetical protein
LEDVHEDLRKMKVKGWEERIEKNGGRLFRRPKLTLSCSAEGKYIFNCGLRNIANTILEWRRKYPYQLISIWEKINVNITRSHTPVQMS